MKKLLLFLNLTVAVKSAFSMPVMERTDYNNYNTENVADMNEISRTLTDFRDKVASLKETVKNNWNIHWTIVILGTAVNIISFLDTMR